MIKETSGNLTVGAYRNLRSAIISCRFRPGEKLVISDLCKALGVSLGAVREALSRLATEGLVTAEPQKGFRVAPISEAELQDLTQARALIEESCLDRAIGAGDVKWEAGIVSALHELSRIPLRDAADPERINDAWTQAHARFHAALVAACDSPWLLRLREILYAQSERYRQLSVPLDQHHRDVDAEHRAIADAVLAREAPRAKGLSKDHMLKTMRILIEAKVVEPAGAAVAPRKAAPMPQARGRARAGKPPRAAAVDA
ncbi:MAG: FCD domain-containing protein [Geminicoccaceae bacterium]|nr:FCD domain-containing protein [Geminicoccaceae bacterium]